MVVSMNKTEMQKTYPSAEVEPKWSLPDSINTGPLFAMYLLLGAKVTDSPGGRRSHVSLIIDDKEHVMTTEDYNFALQLSQNWITGFLDRKGYYCDSWEKMRTLLLAAPSSIVDAIRWMQDDAFATYDPGETRSKIFWLFPDNGACGHYRSETPHNYMKNNFQDEFHSEIASFVNYKALTYFEAIVYSRIPSHHIMAMMQNLSLENKVMVWETDDDLLNIPDWSISKMMVPQDLKNLFETCRDMADIIFVTTEHLKTQIGRPAITHVAPNMIDMNRFTNILGKQRPLTKQYSGYFPRRVKQINGNHCKFFNKKGVELSDELMEKFKTDYQPVRILWSGSNTHDADLDQICEAVKMIGDEYGIGIRFFWFGYCPPIFGEMSVMAGNVQPEFTIKNEFSHYMEYLHPVSLADFPKTLSQIAPDFSVCPLLPHEFNKCKSNIKPLEVGAMGVPSIVSDYGPYEFIKNRYDGIKVEHSDDPKILTQRWFIAMSQMIEQRHLREEMAQRIYDRTLNEYSWQTENENRKKWNSLFQIIRKTIEIRRQEKMLRLGPMYPARELEKSM